MRNRNWLTAVAFGLIAGSLQAQEQTQPGEDRPDSQEQAPPEQPLGIPVRIIEDDEAAEARESRETISAKREQEDLIAQQRMAEATEAMNEATKSMKDAAWLSFYAVALGTGLLIWTLSLTRKANIAAQGAVDVTREMGVAQARAYVHIAEARAMRKRGLTLPGDSKFRDVYQIILTAVNTGQTPALWYEVEGTCSVLIEQSWQPLKTITIADVPPLRWNNLNKDQPLRCPFNSEGQVKAFAEAAEWQDSRIRLDGVVRYRTMFEETLESTFSFYCLGHEIADRMLAKGMGSEDARNSEIEFRRPKADRDND